MNSLRFLLVHRDPEQSEEIAARLALANHTVLPTSGLEEAADALTIERFDAVLMESEFRKAAPKYGLPEFSAQLRRMEQSQKYPTRVPVIALANGLVTELENGVDAVVPEPLDPEGLTAAVTQLARAVSQQTAGSASSHNPQLKILDPEKFREQVGYDNELLVEIIDLFLEERLRQEPAMRSAFESGSFEELSRVAHTIKGSLGSLHAERAQAHAQDLELSAKRGDEPICRVSLVALETDLADLEPELLALRMDSI